MVQNKWEKTAGNLEFVENVNYIRGSTEAAVCECSGTDLHYKIHVMESCYIEVTGLKAVSLL